MRLDEKRMTEGEIIRSWRQWKIHIASKLSVVTIKTSFFLPLSLFISLFLSLFFCLFHSVHLSLSLPLSVSHILFCGQWDMKINSMKKERHSCLNLSSCPIVHTNVLFSIFVMSLLILCFK